MITWFKRNLVLISTSKFFKDNKTAWAHRASAICSLWKIYKCVLYQIAWEIMLSLVNNIHEKTSKRVKTDVTFNSADMLFVICTHVITLQSCYNFALVLQLCTLVTILHLCYMRKHKFHREHWITNLCLCQINLTQSFLSSMTVLSLMTS